MPFNKITQYKPGFSQNINKIMSFIKIYFHFVWSTKSKQALLTNNIRHNAFNHMDLILLDKDNVLG